ncbi:retrovirus-related pol polyprotein from transposon TNT 1-94, partial [Tanacetum coccineum]
MKGKSVETKFEKSSVIRQPNAFKSQRQSVLGKLATFSDSLAKTDFSKSKSVSTNNVSNDFSKPVIAQILPQNVMSILKNTNMIAPGMTRKPITIPFSTREHKRTVNQSAATPLKRTVASESTNQKPRSKIRKQYEQINKTCRWSYCPVKFGNDQIAPILGYGDLVQGNITIKRVYYVEGLNHNLFSVGQFCDADLEVAFRKSTCYIRDLKGNDLLTGSRGTNMYSITLQDISTPNPICLMAKASSSQAWLWHHRLSHLNFDSINLLSKNDIVIGIPKLKFVKDHLCSSCELGKSKRKSFHQRLPQAPKDGYNFYTWTYVVPCGRNHTIVEAAQTMLSAAKVPLYFWAEAIATTCFTQNHSLVIPQHEKTPYHIINSRKPSVKFFHIFGSLCYIVRDGENLDKMKEKGDACIFVGYSTQSRAYRVYNKRTKVIVKTIHVNFDKLPQMASDHVSSDPVPQCPTTALEHDSLSPGPQSQENVPQATKTVTTPNELDLLFS